MKQIETITDRYGSPIFTAYISSAAPRRDVVRKHYHTAFEISLILSGKGTYKTQNGYTDIEAGDIFLFSTNEVHCITDIEPTAEGGGMEILNMKFAPSFVLQSGAPEKDTEFMNIFINRKPGYSNKLDRANPARETVRALLLSIKEECEKKEPCHATLAFAKLLEIFTVIYRRFDLAEKTAEKNFLHLDNVSAATAYINRHFTESISLDDIIRAAGMNKTTFITAFRSIYNMTTWDYVNIKRIEKARTMLKNTHLTVLDIALQCGYNSTANFNKIFKKIVGVTPRDYRK